MRNGIISLLLIMCSVPVSLSAMPAKVNPPGEKLVLVSPQLHQWGAYDAQGNLIRSGVASTGADYCPDMGSPCHTREGMFRIRSLGDADCKSPTFPLPKGGGPMPYCMYFNSAQALHGYPHVDPTRNASHGCVRMRTEDARWLRYNFVQLGTLVEIAPY
jgi:hypothetical protein